MTSIAPRPLVTPAETSTPGPVESATRTDDGGGGQVADVRPDRARFAGWFDTYHGRAKRLAWRVCRNEHDAEDAVQEAFLRAFQRRAGLADRDRFDGWLMRITRNAAVDELRRSRRCRPSIRATDETTDEVAGLERVMYRSGSSEAPAEAVAAFRAEFDALSENGRRALEARYLRGWSCERIAEHEGRSLSCIKTRIHRARRRLQQSVLGLR